MRLGLLGIAAATLLVAGCAQATNPQTIPTTGPPGLTLDNGDILIRDASVQAPSQVSYPPGADATIWLTLLNQGSQPDALVQVTSPYATRVEIRWDKDCNGNATVVPELPLAPSQGTTDGTPGTAAPPFAGYSLVVVGLRQAVYAGTTIPVTMRFQHAPALDTAIPVEPSNANVAQPSTRCEPVAGATPSG